VRAAQTFGFSIDIIGPDSACRVGADTPSPEMMMTRAALLALAGLFLAGAAHAQPAAPAQSTDQAPAAGEHRRGGGMGEMREACAADMKTFCGDAGQDRAARRQCMTAHQAQFSQGCQDATAKMRAWREAHPRTTPASPQ